MRVLFDTNVVLDVLLDRQPHAGPAIQLFEQVAQRRLQGLLGATTVTTIHYLTEKAVGRKRARGHLETLLGLFEVAAVDRAVLTGALELGFGDFEDAVLHEAAAHAGATGIVTRDIAGFRVARLTVYAPDELVTLVEAGPHR